MLPCSQTITKAGQQRGWIITSGSPHNVLFWNANFGKKPICNVLTNAAA